MDQTLIIEDLKKLLTVEQRIENTKDQIDQLNIQLQPMNTAVKIDEIFQIADDRQVYYNKLMELQHILRDLEEDKYNLSQNIISTLPLDNQKVIIDSQEQGKIIIEKKVDPYGKEEPVLLISRQ
jgi:chaperonin cofactor prefoldin